MTDQFWKQKGAQQEGVDTLRIWESLRLNPPSFTCLRTSGNLDNFVEEVKKVFDVMHMVGAERVELAAYQVKSVARTLFDQWKDGRAEGAPHPSWDCFEATFLWEVLSLRIEGSKGMGVPHFVTVP